MAIRSSGEVKRALCAEGWHGILHRRLGFLVGNLQFERKSLVGDKPPIQESHGVGCREADRLKHGIGLGAWSWAWSQLVSQLKYKVMEVGPGSSPGRRVGNTDE